MTALSRLLHLMALPTAAAVAYAIYLGAGGNAGREYIKHHLARATISANYTIRDNASGGDCSAIGTWDSTGKSCRLTGDPAKGSTIYIRDDGVTLDGAGRLMAGSGSGIAITLIGATDVTLRDLRIENYLTAVRLQYARRNTISGLRIRGTASHAIHLTGRADLNAIVNNAISSSEDHGIAVWSSQGNLISNNLIDGTTDGIRLQSSDGNVIALNDVRNSEIEAVDLHTSRANRVVLNNLVTAPLPVLDDMGGLNLYSLAIGGNYYVATGSDSTACVDADQDGLCDMPYRFASGVDPKPLGKPITMIRGPQP